MTVGVCTYDVTGPEVVELARLAEAAGFDSLWLGEHAILPSEHASTHPAQVDGRSEHRGKPIVATDVELPEPLLALAAAAAATTSIRLATGIYLLPLRHPLQVARSVATLQDIADGRFLLGVGTGWLREEFDALDVEFDDRGARFDEAIEVARLAWQGEPFAFDGAHFRFDELRVTQRPIAVPLVLGGNSERALARCARVADGWLSSGNPTFEEAVHLADRLRELTAAAGTGRDFRMFVRMSGISASNRQRYADAGIDDVIVWAHEIFSGVAPEGRADAMHRAAAELGLPPGGSLS